MAATTKKKKPASSTRTRSGTSGKKNTAVKPIRREVGAFICLLLAIFCLLGCFQIHAIFIDFFCDLVKGLIGYGFFPFIPLLLITAWILFAHHGRPVQARVWCTLLLPIFIATLIHLIARQENYALGTSLPAALWSDGQALHSGGLLGGILATGLAAVFSRVGAGIIVLIAAIVMVMVSFKITLADLIAAIRNRPRLSLPEYEEEDDLSPLPERQKKIKTKPIRAERGAKPSDIDLPMDDPPTTAQPEEQKAPEPILPVAEQKAVFFNKRAAVPAPDEVLRGDVPAHRDEYDLPLDGEDEPLPEDGDLLHAPSSLSQVKITREPAVTKAQQKAEQAQAAAEVALDLEKGIESTGAAGYQYPPVSLLHEGTGLNASDISAELAANQLRLTETIHSFGIDAAITNVTRGPSVTRYELELDQGVRLNKLTNLSDDIALALGATGVRIAPIPNQISMVGIEVPNKLVTPVAIHEVIDSSEFRNHSSKVAFAVGKDIGGNNIVGNIAKLPHMLIAGTTGSGKSVCTNSLIVSLLYKATPEEVRLIMVDPKMVELGIYNSIPHLLIPVVTDPKKAAGALQWAVTEMMKRYRAFSDVGVRDLASYNAVAARNDDVEKMPQIVIVIDELADLMLVAAKEVEESICRVAQMGRASGMHLIIATQRPSADVITGLMKANIPSRIAFAVASSLESRIILDTTGAEKLVGRGDMLYFPLGTGKPQRVQGCLITDEEVAEVVAFVKRSGSAEYSDEILKEIEQNTAAKEKGGKGVGGSAPADVDNSYDELLPTAIEVVVETGMASVSMLQRRLKLGYSRAARMVDQMEEKGIVGPFEGSKPRQVLITKEQWQELQFKQNMNDLPLMDAVPEELAFEGDAFSQDSPPFDMDDDF